MESEVETETMYLGKNPYFIKENSDGTYFAPEKVEIKDGKIFFSIKEDNTFTNLVLGIDMKEVPTRGLELYLESHDTFSAMNELRKFAQVTESDYYSFEPYGNSLITVYYSRAKVRPRIFRKIIDN